MRLTQEVLNKGRWLVKSGMVRVVTANVQGRFAGVFGQVAVEEDSVEVSIVVQLSDAEGWRIDGRSDPAGGRNDEFVAALLMAAMLEKGAADDVSFGLGEMKTTVFLFSADVRAGILHWDDSDARAVLEKMPLARVEGESPKVESRLREMGLKRLVEMYPWDEIEADFRQCYGYSAVRKGMQEVFWADFLSNRRLELEELGCEITVDGDFGLQVVEPMDFYGELQEDDLEVDWFGFEYGIRIKGERVNLLPCIVRYLESRPSGFTLRHSRKSTTGNKVRSRSVRVNSYAQRN